MSKADLLKQILSPLIEDYRYWFDRSRQLLEREPLEFISPEAQAEMLQRVQDAQAELQTATMLYQLSDHEVGIDPALMAKWHRLLMECAELGRHYHQLRSQSSSQSQSDS